MGEQELYFCDRECVISDLLQWKVASTSCGILLCFNLLYLLVFGFEKSLVTIISYGMMCFLLIGFLMKILDVAPASAGPVEIVSKETIKERINTIYNRLNCSLSFIRDIFLWRDVQKSLKYLCILFVSGYISSYFSLSFLLYVAVSAAFGFAFLRKIYYAYAHPFIQPHLKMAGDFACKVFRSIPKMDDLKQA